MNIVPLAFVFFAITLLTGAAAFNSSEALLQNILLAAASAFLSVFLGLLAVNVILNSSDRKKIAHPLLMLLKGLAEPLHNDLFIQLGRDTFGAEKFNNLIDSYQRHDHSPEVFSPDDLERIYGMITSRRNDILNTYEKLEIVLRDIAAILGWGYDARILGALLSARGNIANFTALLALGDHDINKKKEAGRILL